MNFSDYFVEPDFSADVQDARRHDHGACRAPRIRAPRCSSQASSTEFSPVSIEGELQPFAFDRHTDLKMAFENISLPIFNPYSGPLAGYNIAKGKLTTRLHYRIDDRKLDAQHNIRIDQLEWGEASATQGEATLPVKFATSLLKDRDGVIKLDVPVGGTLDDPTFRVGPIVWQVIKNLIVKAVTAPFALLGSLFAGAEEAQFVDFAPGEAALDPATAERLDALAKSLAERPQLKLDVPIGAMPDIDRPALAERAYQAALADAVASRKPKSAPGRRSSPGIRDAGTETAHRGADGARDAADRRRSRRCRNRPRRRRAPRARTRRRCDEAATLEFLEQAAHGPAWSCRTQTSTGSARSARGPSRRRCSAAARSSRRASSRCAKARSSAHEGKVRFELGLE